MCCQMSWWIAAKSQISYQQGEDQDNMTGRSTLDVLSEQIPTRLNEPIRYRAKFKPLWLPETKCNPITSDHICHLLSTTSIQCAVMPRNDAFVLSAVQVSAVHDLFREPSAQEVVVSPSVIVSIHTLMSSFSCDIQSEYSLWRYEDTSCMLGISFLLTCGLIDARTFQNVIFSATSSD